jgi:hypothetical protein
MMRRIKDYVEVGGELSLDALIERLTEIRDSLPEEAEAEVKMRGDDIFGRHISIGYLRAPTAEEAALEVRYSRAGPTRLKFAA